MGDFVYSCCWPGNNSGSEENRERDTQVEKTDSGSGLINRVSERLLESDSSEACANVIVCHQGMLVVLLWTLLSEKRTSLIMWTLYRQFLHDSCKNYYLKIDIKK